MTIAPANYVHIEDGFFVEYVTPLGVMDWGWVTESLALNYPADMRRGVWEAAPTLGHHEIRFTWREAPNG